MECISKGKARTPYEFDVKLRIVTMLKEGLVMGIRSKPDKPVRRSRAGPGTGGKVHLQRHGQAADQGHCGQGLPWHEG